MGLIRRHHLRDGATPSLHILPCATSRLPLPLSPQSNASLVETPLSCLTAFGIGRLFAAGLAHFVSRYVIHSWPWGLVGDRATHALAPTCSVFVGTATNFPSTGVSALPSSLTPASLSHIVGILIMVAAERIASRSTPDANPPGGAEPEAVPLHDDMELADLEEAEGLPVTAPSASPSHTTQSLKPHLRRITLFTFGLVAGEVGSGISIGYAATALSWNSDAGGLAMPPLDAVLSYFVRLMGKSRQSRSSPTRGCEADDQLRAYEPL